MRENDIVFALGKQRSECAYCGKIAGDNWVKGEGNLYCSTDCRHAGRFWSWVCMLLLIVPMSMVLWSSYSYNPEILPILVILLLMILYIISLAIQGIKVRWRISRQKKYQEAILDR